MPHQQVTWEYSTGASAFSCDPCSYIPASSSPSSFVKAKVVLRAGPCLLQSVTPRGPVALASWMTLSSLRPRLKALDLFEQILD